MFLHWKEELLKKQEVVQAYVHCHFAQPDSNLQYEPQLFYHAVEKKTKNTEAH